jgi:hypothetical protein
MYVNGVEYGGIVDHFDRQIKYSDAFPEHVQVDSVAYCVALAWESAVREGCAGKKNPSTEHAADQDGQDGPAGAGKRLHNSRRCPSDRRSGPVSLRRGRARLGMVVWIADIEERATIIGMTKQLCVMRRENGNEVALRWEEVEIFDPGQ